MIAGEQAEGGGEDAGVVVEEEGEQRDQHAPQQSFLGTAHCHAHHRALHSWAWDSDVKALPPPAVVAF